MEIVKLIATIHLQRELDRAHNKNEKPPVGIRTLIGYRSSRCNVEEVRKGCKNCTGMMKGRDVLVKEISELFGNPYLFVLRTQSGTFFEPEDLN